MSPTVPFSSLIPVNALLPLGNAIQAEIVTQAGSLGSTMLALEQAYGGVSLEDNLAAEAALGKFETRYRSFVTDSSVAFLKTYALLDFFQKRPLPGFEADFPVSLTDLLLGNKKRLVPANQSTALFGLMTHLGGLSQIEFSVVRRSEGLSLFDAKRECIIDFPAGRAEMQVGAATEAREPLLALISLHLIGLADGASEVGQAARMYHAARTMYPG